MKLARDVRRHLPHLARWTALASLLVAAGSQSAVGGGATLSVPDDAFLDDLSRRTFAYFWEETPPGNGLVPDRRPSSSPCSVAAVGFGLTAYAVGAERGWIERHEAVERTLATLRFFANAPQHDRVSGASGHRGFFYHFLNMETGERWRHCELSSVDTALLMMGVLFVREYYDRPTASEAEVRRLADGLFRRVQWDWMQPRANRIAMAWTPEQRSFGDHDYRGYNEAMLLYLIALGSPTHPIDPAAWPAYTASYRWQDFYGQPHVSFGPLFGHQYSHVWIDFRGVHDRTMRTRGIDYFENSRRATLAQRAYAAANPGGWNAYGPTFWGLTACDGPVDATRNSRGQPRRFESYAARGAANEEIRDDGTLAPAAAGGSLPFAPSETIAALRAMKAFGGDRLYQRYGFLDSFNPSFTTEAGEPTFGTVYPDIGWVNTDYVGINQGPILLMAENARSGFIWEVMRRSPYLRAGMRRAGFTGGWLDSSRRIDSSAPPTTPSATE